MKQLITILTFLWATVSIAQPDNTVTGIVLDTKTKKPIAFASVYLQQSNIGTITNEGGKFSLPLPKEATNDTLFISFLGYEQAKIPIKDKVNKPLKIKLKTATIELSEVLVRPLSPTEYIKKAIQQIKKNYPSQPFATTGYYREKFRENKQAIQYGEAIFKSYYPNYQDTTASQHQILLHREPEALHRMEFMKDKMAKKNAKAQKKAAKKGKAYTNRDAITVLYSGPENSLKSDIIRYKEAFLDSTKFKKYKFSFGKPTTYQGKEMITIHFKSKRVVNHLRQKGTLYIEPTSYALALVEYSGDFVIPALARPVLLVMGLKTHQPTFHKKLQYQYRNGKWYPATFHMTGKGGLTKRHLFTKNEYSFFMMEQLFTINQLNTNTPKALDKKKVYDKEKAMQEQIYNDEGISWEEVTIVQ